MIVYGPPNCGGFGGSLALVDLNDDGMDELIVGDFQSVPGVEDWAGEITVIYGRDDSPPEWVLDLTETAADLRIFHDVAFLRMGTALAGGDFNGDGAPDLLIGTGPYEDMGRIYGLLGPIERPAEPTTRNLGTEPAEIQFETAGHLGDGFGQQFALADVDGDGKDDLLAGVPDLSQGDNHGAAFFYFGREIVGKQTIIKVPDVAVLAGSSEDFVALGVSIDLGDLTGDGVPDLLASDPFHKHGDDHSGLLALIDGTRLAPDTIFNLTDTAPDLSLYGAGDWQYYFERFEVVQIGPEPSQTSLVYTAPKAFYGGHNYNGIAFRLDQDRLAGHGPEVSVDELNPNTMYYGPASQFFLGQLVATADISGGPAPEIILGAAGFIDAELGGAIIVFEDHLAPGFPGDDDDDDDDDNDDNDNNDDDNDDDDTAVDDDTPLDDDDNDDDTAPGDDDDDNSPPTGDDDSDAATDDDDDDDDSGCGC
jgi:FG-GAP repeat